MNQKLLASEQFKNHLVNLERYVKEAGELFEGCCMYQHGSLYLHPNLKNKQINLLNISKNKSKILEIGFNAGHSCLLFLMSDPNSTIQAFDLGDHKYTAPCYSYLQQQFPGRLNLIYGDSTVTLPEFINNRSEKFDLLHVDGGHSYEVANSDMNNCKHLAAPGALVIFDDVDFPDLARLYVDLIKNKVIEPVNGFYHTPMYPHALCRYL